MNGWIKRFFHGTIEIGKDEDVRHKKASWSKGRLQGIKSVELHHKGIQLTIEGAGEYWQSDDYEVDFGMNIPILIARRIQKKVQPEDRFVCIFSDDRSLYVRFLSANRLNGSRKPIFPIDSNNIGKWITLEYNLETGNKSLSYEEKRI